MKIKKEEIVMLVARQIDRAHSKALIKLVELGVEEEDIEVLSNFIEVFINEVRKYPESEKILKKFTLSDGEETLSRRYKEFSDLHKAEILGWPDE